LCDWIQAIKHRDLRHAINSVVRAAAGRKMKSARFGKTFLATFFVVMLWSQKAIAAGAFLAGSQADIVNGWLSEPFTPFIFPSREYRLYVPSAINNASNAVGRKAIKPAPLLVMLHGCKQSPETFAAGTEMNLLA
jgi:poly(3-hydroxybutyrate) depolymerase